MNYKHGMRRTRMYRLWTMIKQRTTNPKYPSFPRYGGRGIRMHALWVSDAARFIEDVLRSIGAPPEKTCLDRVDNERGYEPGNLRWATPTQSARNTRRCHHLTYKGQTLTLKEWCERLSLSYRTTRARLWDYGWSIADAFEIPVGPSRV